MRQDQGGGLHLAGEMRELARAGMTAVSNKLLAEVMVNIRVDAARGHPCTRVPAPAEPAERALLMKALAGEGFATHNEGDWIKVSWSREGEVL